MLEIGLRKSRPPSSSPHPGLRAIVVAVLGTALVLIGLGLAALDLAANPRTPVRRDFKGRRIQTPLMIAAGGFLTLGAFGAFFGVRTLRRQRVARGALREWAEGRDFALETPDEAVRRGEEPPSRVRILYRAGGLGDAAGVLVMLRGGWLSEVMPFSSSQDTLVRRIDAVLASARRYQG